MKYLFPLVLLMLLFSCKSKNDDTIALFDQTVELSNEYFYGLNMQHYGLMDGLYEANKSKIKPFKVISDSIKNMYDELTYFYETIKKEIIDPYNKEDHSYLQKNIKTGTREFFENTEELKNYILNTVEDSLLSSEIINILDLTNYKKDKIKYWKLNLLINKIYLTEYLSISSINNKIAPENFKWLKFKPVIIKNRNTFKNGQQLITDIWLSATDTTYNHRILLESDTFYTTDGIFLFKEKPKNTVQRKIKGKLLTKKPGSTEIDSFPFTIEYHTIK